MAFFDGIFCPILQFFNTFLSPAADPDRPRGGPSHVDIKYFLCKKIKSIGEIVWREHTLTDKLAQMHYPGSSPPIQELLSEQVLLKKRENQTQ